MNKGEHFFTKCLPLGGLFVAVLKNEMSTVCFYEIYKSFYVSVLQPFRVIDIDRLAFVEICNLQKCGGCVGACVVEILTRRSKPHPRFDALSVTRRIIGMNDKVWGEPRFFAGFHQNAVQVGIFTHGDKMLISQLAQTKLSVTQRVLRCGFDPDAVTA